jgi:hypothetical protein
MRTTRALAVSAAAVVALGLAAPSAVAGDEPNNGNGSRNGIGGDGPGGGNGNGNRNGGGPGGNGNNGFDGNGLGNNGFGGNGNGFGPGGNLGLGGNGNGKDNGRGGFPGNGLGGNGFPGFPGNGLGGDGFPGFPGNGLGGDGGFGDNISVAPSVVRPGQHNVIVTVQGNVAGVACQLAGSKVESGAFQTTRLRPGSGNTAVASVTINRDAKPGLYGVRARCGGTTFDDNGENELAVIGHGNRFGGNGPGFGGDSDGNGLGFGGNRDNNGLPGPVAGGLGGSLAGATATDTAIGGGLVAASAAIGGVFWLRRRAEKRG